MHSIKSVSSEKIAVAILLALFLILCAKNCQQNSYQTSYWLWAGITADDAPTNSELYVYQGLISSKDGISIYERHGLYPHPIKAQKLYLSYRLEGRLPDPQFVVQTFKDTLKKWERHPVLINGLQLDFDSPTSKLLIYSNFLSEIRHKLPKQYELSITGLGDWAVYGDKQAMQGISQNTNEIIFQLYQGRKELRDVETYINALSRYPLPYRIGLLVDSPQNRKYIDFLSKNDNFNGVVYFLQKGV